MILVEIIHMKSVPVTFDSNCCFIVNEKIKYYNISNKYIIHCFFFFLT